ncbi:MAG: pyridoxal phosphate-dependent aminotransferase [Candidatus Poribacteria bacterium]|nr:pyridoxal phosphate-dependent aminotransferase [Candidatus Poribacteria bacterium]
MNRLGTESAFEVLAKAKGLEAQGKDIIHLEIGQPDFSTPMNVCEAAFKAMKDGHTGYCPSAGLPEFREVVAHHISETRGVDIHPDEVTVTPGAKPIIFFTILALIDDGDEVIYPEPGFPVYESVIDFIGGKAVPLALREEVGFRFRIDDLIDAISDRTKLLILNSPQNPTGGTLTETDLNAIAELSEKHNFYILTDEVYSRLLYEGSHKSVISLPGMKERTILIDGHSKTYAMTGWRLGYGIAPREIADKITQLTINSNSCTATFTQIAGIEALTGPQTFVSDMVTEFRIRRDTIVDGLNAIEGISCVKPLGSFYVFPNVTQISMPCEALADYLMDEVGVALLPGTAFGKYGDGYLRLSYANSLDNINDALSRIRTALAKL